MYPQGLSLSTQLCPLGIEPQGNTVLQPAHFTVQTADAGLGEVLVYIEDPEGHTEEVTGMGHGLRIPGSIGLLVQP